MYNSTDFAAGKVSNGQIILNQPKEFGLPRSFYSSKFAGNQLIWFRTRRNEANVKWFEFCKMDLIELTEKTVKVPYSFEGNYLIHQVRF